MDPRKIQTKMENSSSGDQRNRSSRNQQGQRGGQRRRSNRNGGGSNRRSRSGEDSRSRQSGGKREYRPTNRGRQVVQPPSFGQRLLSILTFGLLGGSPKPVPASKAKPATRDGGRGRESGDKQGSPQEVEVTSARLYVGNLDYSTTGPDLEQYFSKVGTVKSAEIVFNRHTQKSKGFAFVEMGDADQARKAVDTCHNEEFMGRRMLVSGAKSPGANDGSRGEGEERPSRQNQRSGSDRNRGQHDGRRDDRRSETREEPRRPKKTEEPVNITSSRLRLDNLDFEVGETELEELFKGIGVVVSTEVAADPDNHQSKGYGFVEMSHIDEAQRAVEILNNKDFMGRRLSISGAEEGESAQEDSNPEEDQSKTAPAVEA